MSMKIFSEPMANIIKKNINNVNVPKLAAERKMVVTNFRHKDGTVYKLFEGSDEIDMLITKDGKILSAHGTIARDPDKNINIMTKIFKKVEKNQDNIISTDTTGYHYEI